MTDNSYAIILCGGKINYSNLPIATNVSNAMIPVNGKPVISWILNDLIKKDFKNIIIVLQDNNRQLYEFVNWVYKNKINLQFAFVQETGTIVNSFYRGLQLINNADSVTVILGDTLILDNISSNKEDFIFVSDKYDDSLNWCLAEIDKDNVINRYYDKEKINKSGLKALTGYYKFNDLAYLKKCCEESLTASKKEISSILDLYRKKYFIYAKDAFEWYDFGHINNFLNAKRNLLVSRYFNSLNINEIYGTIEKKSTNIEKLNDELFWYENIPDDLKVIIPRVLERKETEKDVTLKIEYYGYPNLAELYLFGNFDIEIWKNTIKNLFDTIKIFRNHPAKISYDDCYSMYWEKIEQRLELLKNQDGEITKLLNAEAMIINGKFYKNFPLIKEQIKEKCLKLCETSIGSLIHGDFCLSNILYDVNNQIIRLIDPRGRFGKQSVYGDLRYDVAKLRHSIVGKYDYIISDLFHIKRSNDGYEIEIYADSEKDNIAEYFDKLLIESGFNLNEIKLIEATLFLSMLPLHQDNPERQTIMYFTAIELFNELINNLNN